MAGVPCNHCSLGAVLKPHWRNASWSFLCATAMGRHPADPCRAACCQRHRPLNDMAVLIILLVQVHCHSVPEALTSCICVCRVILSGV